MNYLSINTLDLWLNKQIVEEQLYNLTTRVTGLNSLEVVDNEKSSVWTISVCRQRGSNAEKYLRMRGINE
jgi:nitrogenase molybdenum-iron protein alpha/beta subunit